MVLALRHPELVERLCVVDVSPVAYDRLSEFEGYVAAMRGLDLDSFSTRDDADAALAEAVPNPTVRSFLLQNLRRDGDGWRWQVNLDVLGPALPVIGGWPEEQLAGTPPYQGPVLWVAGAVPTTSHRRTRAPWTAGSHQPAGDRQGSRPLGPLRAAGGVPRGAATVPRPAASGDR